MGNNGTLPSELYASCLFFKSSSLLFWCRHIQVDMERTNKGSTSRFQFFNSFFFKKLTEKSDEITSDPSTTRQQRNHERVRKWTKVSAAWPSSNKIGLV